MTNRQAFVRALGILALVMAPALAFGQTQPAPASAGGNGGIGVGVKGGVTFSSLTQKDDSYALKNRTGVIGGLFFGGNRSGWVGIGADVLYAQKGARNPDDPTEKLKLDYINVPVYARINVGSSNINYGASVYAIAGVDLNVLMSAKQNKSSESLKDEFESFDYGFVLGLGVEVSRLVVEGRYTKGLANIVKDASEPEVKNQSFAVMVGVRLH